ncbi:MAG: restriction endonuclease subunit S [Ruminococcaceae bacterium]|nr:restriction endonuclease subunit S [Oscillospiraceae bacterium]
MREMKDSGVDWIGTIPADWQIKRIGHLFQNRNEKVNDTDYPPLSVSKGGIVPQMENVAKSDANDNRKQVLKNDFVINSRSDRKQSCGVSDYDGSVSLINTVLFEKEKGTVNPAYNNYLLKNYGFAEEFYRWGHGIVADLWTTRWQEMKNIDLPVPPYEKQRAILNDIEANAQKVDALISNQEQQIEKLKAYKQSLITEVVTKGLNHDAPMKDSGVAWIGEIPSHWETKRAKFLANRIDKGNGITREDVIPNGNVQCVRYGEIYTKYNGAFSKCYSRTNIEKMAKPQYISYGDILFSGTGEIIEEIGKNVVYLGTDRCIAGGDIIIFKHNQEPRFLNYALNSEYSQKQKSYGKMKLKVVHISASAIGNIIIAFPDINEQKKIADYLDEKCSKIDKLIEIKQQKIEKLNEYKKSLIYEYVTGKKEV